MELIWIKPLRKPPGRDIVDGMSSSARKVLVALTKRFPQGCSFGVPYTSRRMHSSTMNVIQRQTLEYGERLIPSCDTLVEQLPCAQFPARRDQNYQVPRHFAFPLIHEASTQQEYSATQDSRVESHSNPVVQATFSSSTPRRSPQRSPSVNLGDDEWEELSTHPFSDLSDHESFEKERTFMGSPVSLYGNVSPIPFEDGGGTNTASDNSCHFDFHDRSDFQESGSQMRDSFTECSPQNTKIEIFTEASRSHSLKQASIFPYDSNDDVLRSTSPSVQLNDKEDSLLSSLFSNGSGETGHTRSQQEGIPLLSKGESAVLQETREGISLLETSIDRDFDKPTEKDKEDCIISYDSISTFDREKDLDVRNSADNSLCIENVSSEDIFDSSDERGKNRSELAEDDHVFSTSYDKSIVSPHKVLEVHKDKRMYLGNAFKRAFESISTVTNEEGNKKLKVSPRQYKQQTFNVNSHLHSKSEQSHLSTNNGRQQKEKCEKSNPFRLSKTKNNRNHQTDLRKFANDKLQQSVLYFEHYNQQRILIDDKAEKGKSTDSEGAKKRRLKFKVPYKNKTEMNLEKTELQKTPKSFPRQLGEGDAQELKIKLDKAAPIEIVLTILFKEGFTQLNKPRNSSTHTCHPEALLLLIEWRGEVEFLYMSWSSFPQSTCILKELLLRGNRNICFGAQEMCQLLIDKFHFDENEVSLQLLFLDPLVGCWLLNPDQPPETFDDICTVLKVSEAPVSDSKQLLTRLSKAAERLYQHLLANDLWKLFLHVEMRITPILACMELHGITIDVQKLQEMANKLEMRLSFLQKEAHKTAGRVFQLTSPQQLGTVLYEELKLDTRSNITVKETLKRQHKSTSESTLIQFKDHHPLPGIVIEFRKLHKLKTTYVDAVLEHASGNCLHSTWHQTSVATGRIVSTDPNLQAVPKHPLEGGMPFGDGSDFSLRSAYVARPGCSFLAADFQHIELRVFAHVSKDNALIQALCQPQDIFIVLAQRWLECNKIEDVSTEDRDKTKRIIYSLMYGAGPSKLVEFLQVNYQQACKILKSFTDTFPSMEQFSQKTSEKCSEQGFLATESGRRRWFPNIKNGNTCLQQQAERQAVNFLIQGTAADICKCAMVQSQRMLAKNSIEAHLLLQIHDELLWEVNDSDVQKASDLVKMAMEEATTIIPNLGSFSVPLPVVVKYGKTWADMRMISSTSFGLSSQAAPP